MSDFIAKYGIFSGVGVVALTTGISLLVRHFRQKRLSGGALRTLPPSVQPRDVDVIPLWFEVSLVQQIPEVSIWVQVVNYTRKELRLTQLSATYFHISTGGPPMENIPGVDHRIPPRQSWQVMCRRHLLDSEVKALLAVKWSDRFSAHLNLRIRGAAGKKEVSLDPSGFDIRGWVAGLPSFPKAKEAPGS